MIKIKSLACIVLASSLALSGCAVDHRHANEQTGTLTGAVAGGILGSTVGGGVGRGVATMVGAMVGGAVGSNIGASMDQQAKDHAERAYHEAMQANHRTHWQHQGYSGVITPASEIFYIDGRACKRFTMSISVADRMDRINGTACHYGPQGWLVVEEQRVPVEPAHIMKPKHRDHPHFQEGMPVSKDCHCHCHTDGHKHSRAW